MLPVKLTTSKCVKSSQSQKKKSPQKLDHRQNTGFILKLQGRLVLALAFHQAHQKLDQTAKTVNESSVISKELRKSEELYGWTRK